MSRSTGLRERLSTIRHDRKGQSFIEAMVALTIIVTSVSSSLALVQASLTSSRISGSEIIAANLSREGIEVVRSIRDSNWLRGESFKVGLVSGTDKDARPFLDTATGGWTLDFTPVTLSDTLSTLYLLADGTYVHADAAPIGRGASQYRRVVTLNHICRDDSTGAERIVIGSALCGGAETLVGLAVSSRVSFVGLSGGRRTVSAEERIYDWR